MVLEINKIDSLKEKKVYLIQLCTLLSIGKLLFNNGNEKIGNKLLLLPLKFLKLANRGLNRVPKASLVFVISTMISLIFKEFSGSRHGKIVIVMLG